MGKTEHKHLTWGQRLGRGLLRLFGWQVVAELPPTPKYIVIGAFHTSNWDFVLALPAMLALGFRPRWIGKDSLFKPPFGGLMRLLGGIPVVRGARRNFVEQIAEVYRKSEELVIVIAPEGTRKKTDHWKTGFYYIALGAGIPIALGFVDYPSKRIGVGGYFTPSGDIRADMERIRAFYENVRGKFPHEHSQIRLLDKMGDKKE
ncbi:MAG TPA: glycerol acyltransferase [Chloroflexi bacterium]|nr:glycerol acyltransferase [Chloroflexota bacterium]